MDELDEFGRARRHRDEWSGNRGRSRSPPMRGGPPRGMPPPMHAMRGGPPPRYDDRRPPMHGRDPPWRGGERDRPPWDRAGGAPDYARRPDLSRAGGRDMMSYREFVMGQRDDTDPDEFARRYKEYQKEFARNFADQFFKQSLDKEWFHERYDPERLLKRRQTLCERAMAEGARFAEDLRANAADFAAGASLEPPEAPADAAEGGGDERRAGSGSSHQLHGHLDAMLCVARIPQFISQRAVSEAIHKALESEAGTVAIDRILFMDASKNRKHDFEWDAWVVLASRDDMAAAERALASFRVEVERPLLEWHDNMLSQPPDELEHFTLEARKQRPPTPRPFGGTQLAGAARVAHDLAQAGRLAKVLDADRALEPAGRLEPLLQSIVDHPLSTRQRLDISLAWLRRVHLTLYYDYFECADEADLLARELPWYHRATPSSDGEEAASEEVTESVRQSWSETGLDDMDKKIEARISDGEAQVSEDGSSAATSQLEKAAADEASAVEKSLQTFLDKTTEVYDDGRARCMFVSCGNKLFRSKDFCQKHQLGKHHKYCEAWLLRTREPFMRTLYSAEEDKPLPVLHVGDAKVDLVDILADRPSGGRARQRQVPARGGHGAAGGRNGGRRGRAGGSGGLAGRGGTPRGRGGGRGGGAPPRSHPPPMMATHGSQSANDSRQLIGYMDADMPEESAPEIDYGVMMLPPPAKKHKAST